MNSFDVTHAALTAAAEDMRARGESFAIATVVRTLGATAAKPGAKALLSADGEIVQGWVGGGCARGALARSVAAAMQAGEPQLVSLHPSELLDEKGLEPGATDDGVLIARNGCPSKGSMDIFVEPVLPLPELWVFGQSPVARALAALAPQFQWAVHAADGAEPVRAEPTGVRRMVVVATQGQGDLDGLSAALCGKPEFIAFVGSRRKFGALKVDLLAAGFGADAIEAVQAPAGLAIDAVTPDEIALSILAQLTQQRRRTSRRRAAES